MENNLKRFTDVEPHIDYLAKDFATFRQLMLDHLSVLVPNWKEESPADLGHVLVETLAYAADYLSYYQDAVATEAYLDTARLRRSVRRHARLLDYFLHEGCNARVWVQIAVKGHLFLSQSTHLLTDLSGVQTVLTPSEYSDFLGQAPLVFATLHDAELYPAHNEIALHTLNPRQESVLPIGSTGALLIGKLSDGSNDPANQQLYLKAGDVLILDQVLDPQTGKECRDPKRRHAVRLTKVIADPPLKQRMPNDQHKSLVWIEWAEADALPFPLYVTTYGKDNHPVTVARGNIVLADHGRRVLGESLPAVQENVRYRPALRQTGLTHQVAYHHENALKVAASETLDQDPRQAMPVIRLLQQDSSVQLKAGQSALLPAAVDLTTVMKTPQSSVRREWTLRRDLLNSDRFARDYMVEMEENERAFLRFGFGDMGKLPEVGDEFIVDYRIGNGSNGNVGPDTIHHVVLGDDNRQQNAAKLIERVWNPLMAQSGSDPEGIEEVRIHAPYAFHRQREQCITAADYAAMAESYPGVLQAVARIGTLGPWHTVTIYIRRANYELLSTEFRTRLNQFMQHYRQAGYELAFRDPHLVPLRIEIQINLKLGQRALSVQTALNNVSGIQENEDGTRGFFHPANFAMGKPIYRSTLVTALMQVAGVESVEVIAFGRMDGASNVAEIPIGPLEVAELSNDPINRNHGILKLEVKEKYESYRSASSQPRAGHIRGSDSFKPASPLRPYLSGREISLDTQSHVGQPN